MAKAHETIWDGEFIRSATIAEANAAQAAGEAQIWSGTEGYMPGWQMKDSKEFPFPVVPPVVVLVTPVVVDEDEDEDEDE